MVCARESTLCAVPRAPVSCVHVTEPRVLPSGALGGAISVPHLARTRVLRDALVLAAVQCPVLRQSLVTPGMRGLN